MDHPENAHLQAGAEALRKTARTIFQKGALVVSIIFMIGMALQGGAMGLTIGSQIDHKDPEITGTIMGIVGFFLSIPIGAVFAFQIFFGLRAWAMFLACTAQIEENTRRAMELLQENISTE